MSVNTQADIRSFGASGYIDGVYSIHNPQIGTTRSGKTYLKCLLRDSSGEVPARQWSVEQSALDEIKSTGFVWVAGHTQVYNGQIQVIVEQIKPVDVDDSDLKRLLPTTSFNIEEMYEDVCRILHTLEHPAIKALADEYLNDTAMMTGFRRCPAATSVHHAWIGGLLEHTLQVLKLAQAMLPLYERLNRDLVLMGLFLHDLAKISELSWEQGFKYTADGNLVGHIVRGAIWLQIKATVAAKRSGEKLPPDALRVLQHIIVSHHGIPEHGAAKLPSTPEAVFVAMLDNLDAKTAAALEAARPVNGPDDALQSEFTEKVWALETRLYRRDPLAD